MTPAEVMQLLEARRDRSAWDKAVTAYAFDILEDMDDAEEVTLENALNGADDWDRYSLGGCSLIYDEDIAERVCTPSELKRKRRGELPPNSREDWIDVQARALHQAWARIRRTILQNS